MKNFPDPEIQSFERLQVSDGLMINSERWQLAHAYHHQRQNVLYQSLFSPGIVCGLGVAPITAPMDMPAKFRDDRWVQIQPGIAIDVHGNFIVVPSPLDFRISTAAYEQRIDTVYLVLSYVDPAKLKRSEHNEILVETFRINEKTDPPLDTDIELCRVAIAEGQLAIQQPTDIIHPQISQLDLRHRLSIKLRPEYNLAIACCVNNQTSDQSEHNISRSFDFLGQATASMTPQLANISVIDQLSINDDLTIEKLINYQLIHIQESQISSLTVNTQDALQRYVKAGGLLLIEVAIANTRVESLLSIYDELQNAHHKLQTNTKNHLNKLNGDISFNDGNESDIIQAQLLEELEAIAAELNMYRQELTNSLSSLIPEIKAMRSFAELNHDHPLRSQPFLFHQLPIFAEQPLQVLTSNGVITVLGNLSSIWAGQSDRLLTRECIRTCQELGINILNYAAQRHRIMQAMQVNPQYTSNSDQPIKEQRRITNMYI